MESCTGTINYIQALLRLQRHVALDFELKHINMVETRVELQSCHLTNAEPGT